MGENSAVEHLCEVEIIVLNNVYLILVSGSFCNINSMGLLGFHVRILFVFISASKNSNGA